MESGRGAERLLSPKLRQASVRVAILALAAMTSLAVSGCGDSSSDEQAASAPASQSEQAEAGGAASAPASQQEAGSPAGKPSAPSPSPSPVPGSGREAPASQGNQGSTVPLPSGAPEKGITPQQRAKATVLTMRVESPALQPTATTTGGVATLPTAYTCDGRDTWPELTWQGVPEGTAELALYVMNLQPVGGELFYGWTVAGLDPNLTGIPSGRLPKGAVEGRNSSGGVGYTICPPKGSSETFLFALYALPERLGAQRGFDPNAVRREIATQAGNSGVMAVGYRR